MDQLPAEILIHILIESLHISLQTFFRLSATCKSTANVARSSPAIQHLALTPTFLPARLVLLLQPLQLKRYETFDDLSGLKTALARVEQPALHPAALSKEIIDTHRRLRKCCVEIRYDSGLHVEAENRLSAYLNPNVKILAVALTYWRLVPDSECERYMWAWLDRTGHFKLQLRHIKKQESELDKRFLTFMYERLWDVRKEDKFGGKNMDRGSLRFFDRASWAGFWKFVVCDEREEVVRAFDEVAALQQSTESELPRDSEDLDLE